MKKSLLALSAAWIAVNGMAATPNLQLQASSLSLDRSKSIQPLGKLHVGNASGSKLKAPARLNSPEDVITEVQGSEQQLALAGSGYYLFWGMFLVSYENQDNIASHMVYGADNEVYIYNILPNAATNSYVKGVKDGDKITIALPQTVYYEEDVNDGFNLSLLKYEEDEESATYVYDESATSVTFSIADDGSMKADIAEDQLLGFSLCSSDEWTGYGAWELTMKDFNDQVVELPSGYAPVPGCYYNAGEYGWPVTWSPGNGVQYFQGLSPNMPEAWVMCTEERTDGGVTLKLAQNQYVGEFAGSYVYTKAAKVEYDENGEIVDAELMPADYEFEINYDVATLTWTAKDPDVALVFNASNTQILYVDILDNLKVEMPFDFSGTPANPYGLTFEDTYEDWGYGGFFFNVPAVTAEGNLLKSEDLYYVIYVDGEEWTFEPDEYETEEPIQEIPWDLSLYYIYNYGGISREVDFFAESITTLGVQSVYKLKGVETRSDIVSINLDDTDAVDAIAADKKIADVKYYDLSGREVSDPTAGIFVKRVTFADGTTATLKKAIK